MTLTESLPAALMSPSMNCPLARFPLRSACHTSAAVNRGSWTVWAAMTMSQRLCQYQPNRTVNLRREHRVGAVEDELVSAQVAEIRAEEMVEAPSTPEM